METMEPTEEIKVEEPKGPYLESPLDKDANKDFDKAVENQDQGDIEIPNESQALPNGDISEIGIKTPALTNIQVSSRGASPIVFVSLTPGKENLRKSPINLEIAESLLERNTIKEAKLSNLRLRKKADELAQLQPIPIINIKSKKMMGKSPVLKKEIPTRESDNSSKSKESSFKSPQESSGVVSSSNGINSPLKDTPIINNTTAESKFDSSDLIKSAMKLRESIKTKEKKPVKPKLSLTTRGDLIKEKKKQKIKEAEAKKKLKELEGCTFKPKLSPVNQISESGSCIIKRSRSGCSSNKKDKVEERKSLASLKSDPNIKIQRHVFEEHFELTVIKPLDCNYSRVSPADYHVVYKHGYNPQAILRKACPLVDYKS